MPILNLFKSAYFKLFIIHKNRD